MNMIRTEHWSNNYVIGIFFDLSKAFDTVNHSILLFKLNSYGIRGSALQWFNSYLSNRSQFTVVNNHNSCLQPVTIGVPQGSILGPLLFLIYINDINRASNNALLYLFADDSNAFISDSSLSLTFNKANRLCDELSHWFKSNLLSVNYDKTAYILFYPNSTDFTTISCNNLIISMDRNPINRISHIKFLGIFIDENLNFKYHITSLISKINSIRGMLYYRRDLIPFACRRNLYFALVHPHVQYCIEVYGLTFNYIIEPLRIACNRILRTLQNADRFSCVKTLYTNYDTLPPNLLCKVRMCRLVYKSIHLPSSLSVTTGNLLRRTQASHSYSTRTSHSNFLYKMSNKAFFNSYVNSYCSACNEITRDIRNSVSLILFMNKYKKFLIDNYW